MIIDLISTYRNMVDNSKVSQEDIDKCEFDSKNSNSILCIPYFIRPDLKVYQNSGKNGKGEFVRGTGIYPDKECIEEMLIVMQKNLNKALQNDNIDNFFKMRFGGAIVSLPGLIDLVVENYFGRYNGQKKEEEFYHMKDGEKMLNLSDFKGNGCAMCTKRALASHVLLSIVENDKCLKTIFPYKSTYIKSSVNSDISDLKNVAEGHAFCGLFDKNDGTMFIYDPSIHLYFKTLSGDEKRFPGIYRLKQYEKENLGNNKAIMPTSIYCELNQTLKPLNYPAYGSSPYLQKMKSEFHSNELEH